MDQSIAKVFKRNNRNTGKRYEKCFKLTPDTCDQFQSVKRVSIFSVIRINEMLAQERLILRENIFIFSYFMGLVT